jgi:AraC-like DNA-binding protein
VHAADPVDSRLGMSFSPRVARLLHDDVYRRLCRARDFIHEQHAESLTLEGMAREAGVSPYHFLRLFREAFQETPGQCLQRVRLERAKELLRRGDAVTEVCMEVGYSSLGSFSALFTARVGRPPREFQREMRAILQAPGAWPQLVIPYCFWSRLATA